MTDQTKSILNCPEDEPAEGNCFVSAYPPFSCWNKETGKEIEAWIHAGAPRPRDVPFGLYIHIPFCTVRCQYCYYLSYANPASEGIDSYLSALTRELEMYGELDALRDQRLDFVYFGGGTPSILSEEQFHDLVVRLQAVLPWDGVHEVTFECAPSTLTETKLRSLHEHGVTRISMGVQQLNDVVLQKNGRTHLVRDVVRVVRAHSENRIRRRQPGLDRWLGWRDRSLIHGKPRPNHQPAPR